jgi:hypothetical protein
MLVSGPLTAHLDRMRVPFALIGGLALAAWGVARFTDDVDLLTLDPRVLQRAFWDGAGLPSPEIRPGDAEDPLGGVVRLALDPRHDLILGKGFAALTALERRVEKPGLPCPVADPLGLVLLKLEAGSPQDAFDVLSLVEAADALGILDLARDVQERLPRLSPHAAAFWEKIQSLGQA